MTKAYQEISLYHPDHGVKTKTKQEFIYLYGLNRRSIDYLRKKKFKTHKGWVLAENKHNYQDLISARERGFGSTPKITMTLEHPEYGKHTLLATEFIKQFGLNDSTLCLVRQGKVKKHKGWTIPQD